jgi:hypothetical protein
MAQNSYFFTFSPNKQEKIILAPQTSADEDDASATNASATRATGGQRRHQRNVVDGAIAMRATTPAVLLRHEGGGGRRSADVVLPGQEGSGARLPFPAGILRIPVFSVLVALFPQESGFLFRRNFFFTPSGILSILGLRT